MAPVTQSSRALNYAKVSSLIQFKQVSFLKICHPFRCISFGDHSYVFVPAAEIVYFSFNVMHFKMGSLWTDSLLELLNKTDCWALPFWLHFSAYKVAACYRPFPQSFFYVSWAWFHPQLAHFVHIDYNTNLQYINPSFSTHSLPNRLSATAEDKSGSLSISSGLCVFDLPRFTTFSSPCASDLLHVPARLCETLPGCLSSLPTSPLTNSTVSLWPDTTSTWVSKSLDSLCFTSVLTHFPCCICFSSSVLNHNVQPL